VLLVRRDEESNEQHLAE